MPRININLDNKTYEELKDLARRKGKNMSETLRDALAFEKWYQDNQDQGNRVLVEQSSSGTAREIIKAR